VFILIRAIIDSPGRPGILQTIANTTTPMAGGLHLPTALLIVCSLLLGLYCFWDFINEYVSLFLEGGIYQKFAEKSQAKEGGLALNIWGVVQHEGAPVQGIKIELKDSAGNVSKSLNTDHDGRFQFKNTFQAFSSAGGKLNAFINGVAVEKTFAGDTKLVP